VLPLAVALAALVLGFIGDARAQAEPLPPGLQRILAASRPAPQSPATPDATVPDQERIEDLDADGAWDLLRATFPGPASEELHDPAEDRIVRRYLGRSAAEVSDRSGAAVLLSTVPLLSRREDGSLAPTRLGLVDQGDTQKPRNAPFELELDEREPGAMTLGPDAAHAVDVQPEDATGDPAARHDGRLFWANSAPSTDTLAVPTSSGAETFEQLRAPDAPVRFVYRVRLPTGAQLTATADGGAQVSEGGQVLVRVAPPSAIDAERHDVATRLTVEADQLIVEVDHRTPGVRYPVLVDPQWSSSYDWTSGDGFEGWGSSAWPDDTNWYYTFGTTAPAAAGRPDASGLWIVPRGSKTYTWDAQASGGPGAMAYFVAPGNGTISSIEYRHVRYDHYVSQSTHAGDGQGARLAVYRNGDPSPVWGVDRYGESGQVTNGTFSSGPLPPGVNVATFWLFTADCGTGQDCNWAVPSSSQASFAEVGDVEMVLEDPEPPTVTQTGELTTRGQTWVNSTTGPLQFSVTSDDPTSGLSRVTHQTQIRGQNDFHDANVDGAVQPSCDADHHTPQRQGALCTQELKEDLHWDPASLPSPFAGWVSLRTVADDYAGNHGQSSTSTVWVDRDAPETSFAGDLWGERDKWLADPDDHEFTLIGSDTTVAGESGVARVASDSSHQGDDGAPVTGPDRIDDYNACPSPSPMTAPGTDWMPCPTGVSKTLSGISLPEGRTHFAAHATDYAGNQGSESGFDVYVDATRPTLSLSGPLADLDGTWGAPEGPLSLTVERGDALSGVASTSVDLLHDGAPLENVTDRDECPAPAMPSLRPCARSPASTRVTVAGGDLPEGLVTAHAQTRDYAGNARTRQVSMHVDRTPPTVSLEGQLAGLDDGWQDPSGLVSATVTATDNMSGIKAVELWVRDSQGHESRLDAHTVCDESADYSGDGPPCPLQVREPFHIALDRLPDGHNTFFARAIEFTGKRASDHVSVDLDDTPPSAPTQLQIASKGDSTVTLSWQPGPEPPADVGIDHYVVTVVVDGVTVKENVSPYPYATIGDIPPGLDVQFLIDAVDGLHRHSQRTKAHYRSVGSFVCERFIGKPLCDVLKTIQRLTGQVARIAVGAVCVDFGLCWKAATKLGIVDGNARDTTDAIIGQTIGGLFAPSAIYDLFKSVVKGKPLAAAIAALGVIPVARAPKAAARITKYLARNPEKAIEVADRLAAFFGKDTAFVREVLSLALPGYRKLRDGNLSHDGVMQLMRAGNDIAYLAKQSRMLKRILSESDRDAINASIKAHWGATKYSRQQAYGHEAALLEFQKNPEIEILYNGRPDRAGGTITGGPDIIARNTRTGRAIIGEAKGTFSADNPLDIGKLSAPLEGDSYIQTEREWLTVGADKRYLDKLRKSQSARERRAAELVEDVIDNEAIYDVSINQARLPGARVYGNRIDDAVKKIRDGDGVGDVAIVDIDIGE
jgi:hypothetical protein